MHEYEFRLVIQNSSSYMSYLQSLGYPIQKQIVYYAKPHFRYKNGTMEVKRVSSVHAVYHDNLWFKWVHSIETPYRKWNRKTCKVFLHNVGNYQDPFTVEIRHLIQLDSQTQMYTFQSGQHYKLVFEWEYGLFKRALKKINETDLFQSLSRYRSIYNFFRYCATPPYKLNEDIIRKTVKCVSEVVENKNCLYANKLDGVFGLVYSYQDKIKEKWEGYECVVRHNVTLGNGFVFAAEKMENGSIFLLDVYQFQGCDTASWCRREILLECLPRLNLIDGYFIQTYVSDKNWLPSTSLKTDGIIMHDVKKDVIFKCKTDYSIDLVYFNGYFQLPNGRIKCLESNLENGSVYEISISNGRVTRKRHDRFKGNAKWQIDNVLEHGWHGPPIEYYDDDSIKT